MKYSEKNVVVSIAGLGAKHLLSQIREISRRKITHAALFLTQVDKTERRLVYQALLESTIKKIPLVHLRNDMSLEEILLLEKNFHPAYYNIHENAFRYLHKWPGFKKKLLLELAGQAKRNPAAQVEAIGGFCVDLAHYKMAEVSQSEQLRYLLAKKKNQKLFVFNHLNGYNPKNNKCLHRPRFHRDFIYLEALPKFVFGRLISLEMENPIREQIKWRQHILKILKTKFK